MVESFPITIAALLCITFIDTAERRRTSKSQPRAGIRPIHLLLFFKT
jgi:hypothetical protein